MKTYVLYNKYSGNNEGLNRTQKVKEIWKDRDLVFTDMTETVYSDFLPSLAEDDVLLICGGDGTVNRFINDTDGLEIRNDVYLFPTGSGNDFLRDLGWKEGDGPKKINEYIRDLPLATVKGKSYRVLNGVGYGIDGYCCEEGDKLRAQAPGKEINYAGIAIKGLLFHYKPTNATVIVDGKEFKYEKVWLAPTMNGRFYGGGMMATPSQKRLGKDRKLSCLIWFGSGKLPTLIAFPGIFKGEHIKHTKTTKIHEGKEITVRFDRPAPLQIDGETITGVSEYTIKL